MGQLALDIFIPISGRGTRLGRYTRHHSSKAFVEISNDRRLLELAISSAKTFSKFLTSNYSFTIIYKEDSQKNDFKKFLGTKKKLQQNIRLLKVHESKDLIEATIKAKGALTLGYYLPRWTLIWPTDIVIYFTSLEKILLIFFANLLLLSKHKPFVLYILNRQQSQLDNFVIIGKDFRKLFLISEVRKSYRNNIALGFPLLINAKALKILEKIYLRERACYKAIYELANKVNSSGGTSYIFFVTHYFNVNTPQDLKTLKAFYISRRSKR